MHVPIKVDYAVRALVDISMNVPTGGFVRAADTAERTSIPKAYLAQVLHSLRKAGFITSTRGPNGGHALALEASSIKLSQIMALLDTSDSLVQCLGDSQSCCQLPSCAQRYVWQNVEQAVYGVLDAVSIADLSRQTLSIRPDAAATYSARKIATG